MADHNSGFFRYWGKAGEADGQGHLLVYHCLDAAAVGRVLLDNDPHLATRLVQSMGLSPAAFLPALLFFLALHDVGKFSRRFQSLRPDVAARLGLVPTDRPYIPHGRMSLLYFDEILLPQLADGELGGAPADRYDLGDAYAPFVEAAAGHHGRPVETDGLSLADCFPPDDLAAASGFAQEAARLFLPDGAGWPPIEPFAERLRVHRRVSHLLAGFFVLCDWIGSQERFFDHLDRPTALADYWRDVALPKAGRAVRASGVLPPPPARAGFADWFPAIAAPSPLQAWADRLELADGPQLVILEDLTGSGKTEAALAVTGRLLQAGRGQGLYVALPTMATADAMYGRLAVAYRRLFTPEGEAPSLVLAHGSRLLNPGFRRSLGLEAPVPVDFPDEESAAYCAAWLADNKKKTFLAAVGVGTIDQALLAVLPCRHQALRLLGLSRQVLVVDEVHACDAYVLSLLETLLTFQAAAGGSAVLLSATLTASQRERLVRAFAKGLGAAPTIALREHAYPLATRLTAGGVEETPLAARPGSERTVRVELVREPGALLEAVAQAAEAGAAVAYVRNTVADALAAAQALAARLGPERVTLFHARFALCDRLAVEVDILARFGKGSPAEARRGRVVVATQVLEQSLDVDFDLMATDLAPIDLLIQRAGRCCRHPRDDRPEGYGTPRLLVLAPEPADGAGADWFADFLPGAARVYPAHGRLWLTARLLAARGVLRLPEDARELIEGVFGPEADAGLPPALAKVNDLAEGKNRGDKAMADYNVLDLDLGYTHQGQAWRDDENAPTRLGEETVTLRLTRLVDGRLLPWAEDAPPETAWSLSEVRVRAHLVGEMPEPAPPLAALVRQTREAMPDKGRWSVLVPLTPDPERPGWWNSIITTDSHRKLSYSAVFGIMVMRQRN